MLDKIKESVSDVLSGGKQQSGDGPQASTVAEKRGQASSTSGSEDGSDVTEDPESNLYECPSCDSVFVAIDKETCSSCRTPVERIE